MKNLTDITVIFSPYRINSTVIPTAEEMKALKKAEKNPVSIASLFIPTFYLHITHVIFIQSNFSA